MKEGRIIFLGRTEAAACQRCTSCDVASKKWMRRHLHRGSRTRIEARCSCVCKYQHRHLRYVWAVQSAGVQLELRYGRVSHRHTHTRWNTTADQLGQVSTISRPRGHGRAIDKPEKPSTTISKANLFLWWLRRADDGSDDGRVRLPRRSM
ncbi:hypothetical protein HDV57DRAFT_202991 [Trichoderma longibrachiatum]